MHVTSNLYTWIFCKPAVGKGTINFVLRMHQNPSKKILNLRETPLLDLWQAYNNYITCHSYVLIRPPPPPNSKTTIIRATINLFSMKHKTQNK